MKRLWGRRAGVVLSLALATLSASRADAADADGKALFRVKCGVCHLQGGGGTWMLGRRLGAEQALLESRKELPAALVRYVARNGINSMPRFTRVELPDAELDAIALYLSTPRGTP